MKIKYDTSVRYCILQDLSDNSIIEFCNNEICKSNWSITSTYNVPTGVQARDICLKSNFCSQLLITVCPRTNVIYHILFQTGETSSHHIFSIRVVTEHLNRKYGGSWKIKANIPTNCGILSVYENGDQVITIDQSGAWGVLSEYYGLDVSDIEEEILQINEWASTYNETENYEIHLSFDKSTLRFCKSPDLLLKPVWKITEKEGGGRLSQKDYDKCIASSLYDDPRYIKPKKHPLFKWKGKCKTVRVDNPGNEEKWLKVAEFDSKWWGS